MQFEDPPSEMEDSAEPERKVGRPKGSTKLQPDDDTCKQINGLARIQCTQREAAAVLGVHVDTFRDFLHAHEKAMEAWEDGGETGKASLRRHQYKSAESGNATMQIWLGKQWLNQRDSLDTTTTVMAPDAALESRAAVLLRKAGIGDDSGGVGTPEDPAEAV